MKQEAAQTPKGRLAKAIVAGILCGGLLLGLISAPIIISWKGRQKSEAALQHQLTAARGEAADALSTVSFSLEVLENGQPRQGTAVSPNGYNWYTPGEDGAALLALAPGTYECQAAADNRLVKSTVSLEEEQPGQLVLDINEAPQSPELVFFEVPRGESREIPLEITGASEVAAERMPTNVRLVKRGDVHTLVVDGSSLPAGFYPFTLIAKNQQGQSMTRVGVRIAGNDPVVKLYTVEDLDNMRHHLTGRFLLMNDLDMSQVEKWVPIGNGDYPFTGVLDGGGHEITGFHSPAEFAEEDERFSLLGVLENAELKNLIVREPDITPVAPLREGIRVFSCAVFSTGMSNSLVENCACIGGVVSPSNGGTAGFAGGAGGSIITGVFNSTRVFCPMQNRDLPNTGGVLGGMDGYTYVAYCANEAEVKGNHLTAGIVGYNNSSTVTKSINSGYIWGSTLVGEFPPGAIIQTADAGFASCCYFVQGTAGIGGKVFFPEGVINSLVAIESRQMRDQTALSLLGDFTGENPQWAFASLDAAGPVPYGVFKQQAPEPSPRTTGGQVVLEPVEGLVYLYTLDGSDPYTGQGAMAESLEIELKEGQSLLVAAAGKGMRDSAVVAVARQEGN